MRKSLKYPGEGAVGTRAASDFAHRWLDGNRGGGWFPLQRKVDRHSGVGPYVQPSPLPVASGNGDATVAMRWRAFRSAAACATMGPMGFHHVALATKDPEATHRFYTEVMGFQLVKVVTGPTPGGGGGWSRHFFYETGASGDAGMIAFWEIHDGQIGDGFRTDLARSLGLPVWVNHLAWDAATLEDLAGHRERWREHGITVAEVDHGFCTSIYATDPNGIMVEFCCTTRAFTAEERTQAVGLLADPSPPLEGEPAVRIYEPVDAQSPVEAPVGAPA